MWIDTHAHLDAPEWSEPARQAMRAQARAAGVGLCVLPAVARSNWLGVQQWARQWGDAYALGIHPLYVPQASDDDLLALDALLSQCRADPHLVAVGEIGLDFFVPALCEPAMRAKQLHFYRAQLRLAQRHGLPVILHVRRSADALLQALRQMRAQGLGVRGGLAHAFNGSLQQAQMFIDLGFKLGFGGALTFDAARHLRRLATDLPLGALVLETDAPDIAPQWLYVNAQARRAGQAQAINSPAQLPRIGQALAQLRGIAPAALAQANRSNACAALPQLQALLESTPTTAHA